MLGLQLTAIVLLIQPVSVWYLRPLLLSLAILVLLFPAILRTPAVWGTRTAGQWLGDPRVADGDNHHYLFAYWILAIFLALCARRPDRALATSARWLVAAVFLWATLWKAVLSPDYMDGRFYRVRLLTDARFAATVQLVGDLSPSRWRAPGSTWNPRPSGSRAPRHPGWSSPRPSLTSPRTSPGRPCFSRAWWRSRSWCRGAAGPWQFDTERCWDSAERPMR